MVKEEEELAGDWRGKGPSGKGCDTVTPHRFAVLVANGWLLACDWHVIAMWLGGAPCQREPSVVCTWALIVLVGRKKVRSASVRDLQQACRRPWKMPGNRVGRPLFSTLVCLLGMIFEVAAVDSPGLSRPR